MFLVCFFCVCVRIFMCVCARDVRFLALERIDESSQFRMVLFK